LKNIAIRQEDPLPNSHKQFKMEFTKEPRHSQPQVRRARTWNFTPQYRGNRPIVQSTTYEGGSERDNDGFTSTPTI
jgi:hypothetical protein